MARAARKASTAPMPKPAAAQVFQQLRHQRDDEGLQDGLAVADGQGPVGVGQPAPLGRHEFMARHLAQHRRHGGVEARRGQRVAGMTGLLGHLLRQLRALAGELVGDASQRKQEESPRQQADRRALMPASTA